jgi:hypothetical protein
LIIEPFTNQEAEIFLLKIHPNEKKEELIKLYEALHNYPLALAQVSEAILIHNNGIDSYLKKYHNYIVKPVKTTSDITQEYSIDYHDVLNLTLQEIEQRDKKSAELLYMLSLLNMDITKVFLKVLFGEGIENKIIFLERYGMIRTIENASTRILNIHDVLKEEALKRLRSKNATYRKEIVNALVKHFKSFYSNKDIRYLISQDTPNEHIACLYKFIDIALENNIIDNELIDAVIMSLRSNNVLFNKNGNPILYQQIANKIYSKNMDAIDPIKKAFLYVTLIAASSVYESDDTLLKFEKEVIQLLNLIENQENLGALFFIYTRMCQFYLLLGDFNKAKKFLEKAQKNITYAHDVFILYRYWYVSAWLCYEIRDINAGIKALDSYTKLISNEHFLSPVGKFFARDLSIKFKILMGQSKEAQKELEHAIREATVYYNDAPSSVIGELEYTKVLLYFQNNRYDLAKIQCNRALKILTEVFGADIVDLTQAHIHMILGKIYDEKGNHALAVKQYTKALKFYNKKTYSKVNKFQEYGELLAGLCSIYYSQKDYYKAKLYYQKLISIFGLEHLIVGKLIKKLPKDYAHQIRKNTANNG